MARYNDVIVDHYVQIAEYVLEFPGKLPVGGRWQRAPSWMIMSQDYSGCTMFQAGLGHLSREDGGPIYTPPLYLLDSDQPVLAVQREHAEYLVSLGPKAGPKI